MTGELRNPRYSDTESTSNHVNSPRHYQSAIRCRAAACVRGLFAHFASACGMDVPERMYAAAHKAEEVVCWSHDLFVANRASCAL